MPRLRLLGDLFVNALERRVMRPSRQSESRLRLATEAAGAGLWSIDLSTSQAWVTEKVRDLFGLTDHGTLNLQSFMERILHGRGRATWCLRQCGSRWARRGIPGRLPHPGCGRKPSLDFLEGMP